MVRRRGASATPTAPPRDPIRLVPLADPGAVDASAAVPRTPLDVLVRSALADRVDGSPAVGLIASTRLPALDGALGGGLHAGSLTVVAGAPQVDAFGLLLSWGCTFARTGTRVLVLAHGMEEEAILAKVLTQELADLPSNRRSATGARTALEQLSEHLAIYSVLQQGSTRTLGAIAFDHLGGPGVLLIDDLQLHRPATGTPGTRVQQLKRLAADHGIAVVAAARLRSKAFTSAVPLLNDLVDPDEIAYDADAVLILRDPSAMHATDRPGPPLKGRRSLHIAVNRRGPSGADVPLPRR
jgi:hypothetical protein